MVFGGNRYFTFRYIESQLRRIPGEAGTVEETTNVELLSNGRGNGDNIAQGVVALAAPQLINPLQEEQ